MALDLTYLTPSGAPAKRGKSPVIWTYKTADTAATMDTAGYFNANVAFGGAYGLLSLGDLIFAVIVTNLGLSNEAYSDCSLLVVNSKTTAGVIDTTDEVSNFATTDTD